MLEALSAMSRTALLLHASHICSSIHSGMVFAFFSTENFPVCKTYFEFSLPASWQFLLN